MWISFLAIYFLVWWLVIFLVLPWVAYTQVEAGEVVAGTPGSAPAKFPFLRVVAITSVLSAFLCGILYEALEREWFNLWGVKIASESAW